MKTLRSKKKGTHYLAFRNYVKSKEEFFDDKNIKVYTVYDEARKKGVSRALTKIVGKGIYIRHIIIDLDDNADRVVSMLILRMKKDCREFGLTKIIASIPTTNQRLTGKFISNGFRHVSDTVVMGADAVKLRYDI